MAAQCIRKRMGYGLVTTPSYWIWDPEEDENPYPGLLDLATVVVVTSDSVNMTSEACLSGKPVYRYDFRNEKGRIGMFHRIMDEGGYTKPLDPTTAALFPWKSRRYIRRNWPYRRYSDRTPLLEKPRRTTRGFAASRYKEAQPILRSHCISALAPFHYCPANVRFPCDQRGWLYSGFTFAQNPYSLACKSCQKLTGFLSVNVMRRIDLMPFNHISMAEPNE